MSSVMEECRFWRSEVEAVVKRLTCRVRDWAVRQYPPIIGNGRYSKRSEKKSCWDVDPCSE